MAYDHRKYRPFPPIKLTDRTWPDQVIDKAPQWCSVDLRDGNQALIEPMTVEQKTELFDLLLKVGFKQIEVGFPAASQQDFDFVRKLIEEDRIPDDVTIQVLVQAREHLIARTYESLVGAKRAIVHVYNSTSTVQREKVFKLDREGIKQIAVNGASWVQQYADKQPGTDWTFQYSPESFTGTELDFSLEVCNAVIDVWQPTTDKPVIINLPATVEVATPNVYADQIEWFCRNVNRRDSVVISLHTHNDRSCGVAAAELAVMGGADRVEGTLLGNGERTGNMDIVTMALNLYSQGVDPELDFSDMDEVIRVVKRCTQLPVHPRHAYAGDLVYTAFSGSHQDAINKCMATYEEGDIWDIAYLPIDPRDLGRSYEEVIRINSQSGKGGVAYIMEQNAGLQLPRWLQIDFSGVIQRQAERTESEVTPQQIVELFHASYLDSQAAENLRLQNYSLNKQDGTDQMSASLSHDGAEITIEGQAQGSLEAFVQGLSKQLGYSIDVMEYSEHSLGKGVDESAVTYTQIKCEGERYVGVAFDKDILASSLNALLAAVNKAEQQRRQAAAA